VSPQARHKSFCSSNPVPSSVSCKAYSTQTWFTGRATRTASACSSQLTTLFQPTSAKAKKGIKTRPPTGKIKNQGVVGHCPTVLSGKARTRLMKNLRESLTQAPFAVRKGDVDMLVEISWLDYKHVDKIQAKCWNMGYAAYRSLLFTAFGNWGWFCRKVCSGKVHANNAAPVIYCIRELSSGKISKSENHLLWGLM